MRSGIGLTLAMQAMTMLDQLQPVEGTGPVGEVRLVPDPASFVVPPYAEGASAMMADMRRLDGEPWEVCARSFLKDPIATLADKGYALVVAFEPEFTLGRRVAAGEADGMDALVPLDQSLCFSTTGFDAAHDEFRQHLLSVLTASGEVAASWRACWRSLGLVGEDPPWSLRSLQQTSVAEDSPPGGIRPVKGLHRDRARRCGPRAARAADRRLGRAGAARRSWRRAPG
jgi:hypothetical protein